MNSSNSWAEKYRPKKFPEIVGQEIAIETIKNFLNISKKKAIVNKKNHNLYKTYHDLINEKKKRIERYVGPNSLIEMGFARALEKKIYLINPIPKLEYREKIIATNPIILNGNLRALK